MAALRPDALFGDIAACIGFYTRLPVPSGLAGGRSFADAQWAAPVAGAVVGLVAGVVLWLASGFGAPAGVAAALALGAGVALTGALHEDGLADVADGFGGGRDREQKLEIMRDSRLGTYGALALMLSVLARWAALAALTALAPLAMVSAVVAAHAASRATIPALMSRLPPARPDGVSAGVGTVGANAVLASIALGFLLPLTGGLLFALFSWLLLILVFLLVRRLALTQIGGQTGDVLGALQQGNEIALLAAAATLLVPL